MNKQSMWCLAAVALVTGLTAYGLTFPWNIPGWAQALVAHMSVMDRAGMAVLCWIAFVLITPWVMSGLVGFFLKDIQRQRPFK